MIRYEVCSSLRNTRHGEPRSGWDTWTHAASHNTPGVVVVANGDRWHARLHDDAERRIDSVRIDMSKFSVLAQRLRLQTRDANVTQQHVQRREDAIHSPHSHKHGGVNEFSSHQQPDVLVAVLSAVRG